MNNHPLAIITDSTCDLPPELITTYGIITVPLYVIWGDHQYRDRIDIQPKEFFQRLVSDPQHPTTAVAGVPEFEQAIQEAIDKGAKEAIFLTVSGELSGVFQTAQLAAKTASIPVSVVDSRGTSMALGWQVLAAARAREAGNKLADILTRVDQVRKRMVLLITLETMEYLQRGGRVGDLIKWVSNILHVKPLIFFNNHTGKLDPIGLVRTHKALVELMFRKYLEKLQGAKKIHIAVLHGNVEEEAAVIADRVKSELNPIELLIQQTGPALGVHCGPGTLALCGYAEE